MLVFADSSSYWSASDGLGYSKSTEFCIELVNKDCEPVKHKFWYLAAHKVNVLDAELARLQ